MARNPFFFGVGALVPICLLHAPLHASDTTDEASAATDSGAETPGAQIFEPAYFERYSPRNALDMLSQIPGFSINAGDDNSRGLGQVTANVLINGTRLASKSEGIREQLSRIPAGDVVRIEIVDGATLDIPGLNGQVANIIAATSQTSGQFTWKAEARPHNIEAMLYGGDVSLTGKSGSLKYTVALSNDAGRGGVDGPFEVRDSTGELIETRASKYSGENENPRLSSNFTYEFSPDVVANLNLRYGEAFNNGRYRESIAAVAGPDRERRERSHVDGPNYEIGADIEFPLGPGQLKLIGLERYERRNAQTTLIDSFSDGAPDEGFRFLQTNGSGERIGRFEYNWGMLSADWQFSGEAAFNRLDRRSSLASLDTAGEFVKIPFPAGNGRVTEDRYEGTLSFTKQLASALSLQATGGAEYSKIEQTGFAANSRTFTRPKGSVSFAWKPANDFDLSVELRRRVGQLSFGDFLASVNLSSDNANGGNNELVPDQSWNIEVEANKSLGPWGSIKLTVDQNWFEDFVDFLPLANGGEARGNIGDAERLNVVFSGTIQFDPVGWEGAQLDFALQKRWMDVTDPFTGESRNLPDNRNNSVNFDFRQDVPRTSWAYGGSFFAVNVTGYSRRFETGRYWEGPNWVGLFVENKDVFGMTAQLRIDNIFGARNKGGRTLFDGEQADGIILLTEERDRRIGPIFRFRLSGDF